MIVFTTSWLLLSAHVHNYSNILHSLVIYQKQLQLSQHVVSKEDSLTAYSVVQATPTGMPNLRFDNQPSSAELKPVLPLY